MTRLIDTLNQVLTERDLASITEQQYRKAIADYSQFLGHDATETDLDYSQINAWLRSLKPNLAPQTIRNRKKGISVVWNHLAEKGLAEYYQSRRVFSPKVVAKPVVSWTLSDYGLLIQASRCLIGFHRKIPISELLEAWLWVGLDTAFRPSDMREITWDSVSVSDKSITLSQHKTGYVHRASLSDVAIACLDRLRQYANRYVFPINRDEIRYPLKRLYLAAESLGFCKTPGRSIGTLRRLHATLQYEDFGASVAAESLGHHGGTRTVYASYIDHRSRKQGRIPRHDDTGRTGADGDYGSHAKGA
jgi:integrase